MKKFISFALAFIMMLALAVPASAAPQKTNGYAAASATYGAVAAAKVDKLNGNQNGLAITVKAEGKIVAETYVMIKNNSAGEFNVGGYKVYVSTYGNDKIDYCFITYAPAPAPVCKCDPGAVSSHDLVWHEGPAGNCFGNGYDYFACACSLCNFWMYDTIKYTIGHELKRVFDAGKSAWFWVCEKDGCGFWDYAAAPPADENPADYSGLDAALAAAAALDENDYTADSWAALNAAVSAASAADKNLTESSQHIIDALAAGVNGAIENLIEVSEPELGTVRSRISDQNGPLAETEFTARIFVPAPVQMTTFAAASSSWDPVGWTLYTIGSYKTDANGYYYLTLPVGDYLVQLIFEGYEDFVEYISIIDVNRMEEMQPATLIPVGESHKSGTISGAFSDATNNAGLSNVKIEVRSNWNNTSGDPIDTVYTAANGNYSVTLPFGHYTFYVHCDGYIRAVVNITIDTEGASTANYFLNPIDDSEYRIVLTWDEYPYDLDSHMKANSGAHVYYGYTEHPYESGNPYARLDIDVTNGYGPETITIYNLAELGGVTYLVHDYTNRFSPWYDDDKSYWEYDEEVHIWIDNGDGTGYWHLDWDLLEKWIDGYHDGDGEWVYGYIEYNLKYYYWVESEFDGYYSYDEHGNPVFIPLGGYWQIDWNKLRWWVQGGDAIDSYAMSHSNATVRIYRGENLIKTYYVPAGIAGTIWNVFEMDADGTIKDINTVGYGSPYFDIYSAAAFEPFAAASGPLKN